MISYEFLQSYWWFLISVLGSLLVFLLFVQGGQSLILQAPDRESRDVLVNAIGRKWEFTFTMLVVFGGAFLHHSRCSTAPVSAEPIGYGCSSWQALCYKP